MMLIGSSIGCWLSIKAMADNRAEVARPGIGDGEEAFVHFEAAVFSVSAIHGGLIDRVESTLA